MTPLAGGRRRVARRWALPLAGCAISVAAIWLAVRGLDLARTLSLIGDLRPWPLLIVAAALVAQLLVRSLRWSLLLPRPDDARVPVRRLVPVVLVGYLGNAVLPARLGDPVRAALVGRRERIPTSSALGSVVLERAIDTLTLALIAVPATLWSGAPRWLVPVATLVALVAGGVVLAAQTPLPERLLAAVGSRVPSSRRTWVERGERFFVAMDARGREQVLFGAIGTSVVAWMLDGTVYWAVALALGIDLTPAGAMFVSAVTVLGTAVPSAPGYVGTFELAASVAARGLGVPADEALAFAILVHALTVLPLALGGGAALVWMGAGAGDLWRRSDPATPDSGNRSKPVEAPLP